jgi:hypothetical protein
MNRSIANWLATNPGGAVFATGLLGLLPFFGIGFAFFVPGAVPALLSLARGPRVGAFVALGASVLLALAIWSFGRSVPLGLGYAAWVLGPPLALAWVLRRSGSLALCLQLSVLGGIAMLLALHAAFGDPTLFWSPVVRKLAQDMERLGLLSSVDVATFVETLARSLWGWITVLTLLLGMCAVFLARWWQSLAAQPGVFGAEFRGLRLGRVLGIVAAVAIGASLLSQRPLVDDLARFLAAAFAMVGLATVHRLRLERGAGMAWLWAVYLLLLFLSPIAMPVLASIGFVDNWLRSGGSAPREA